MTTQVFRVRRGYMHMALQVVLVALCVRLAVIQCLHHNQWAALAMDMEQSSIRIEPQRGHILDRHGNRIAVTTQAQSVFANPRAVPAERRAEVAASLAELLDCDSERIAARLTLPKYFVWVKRKVTAEQAEAVSRANLPGVSLRQEHRRRYPGGSFLCHVLGFVGTDDRGLEGLEARFNDLLVGEPGERPVHRDGLGRKLGIADAEGKPVRHGKSLVLTIDSRIQHIVEEELALACEEHKPESACAVVMDPWTGDILAMAGSPVFDPAHFQESPKSSYRSMAVVECMEPGSTFKPFVAAAALERGAVSADTVFDCHRGKYRLGSRLLHDAHPLGRLSVRDIVAYSSNIGMAQVGERLGAEGMYESLAAFGFGRRTGIKLPGESVGILHHPRVWSKYTISSITMGQEIAATPLQMAAGFSVFANGGWYVRPRIVLGIADSEGRTTLQSAPHPLGRRVLSERVAKLMCSDILAGVVDRGTASRARIPGYRMAGKTGTAQIAKTDGRGYEDNAYVASFVGIVPADEPRYVIALMARKPSGASHYGGIVAAPAVAQMADRILSMARIPRIVAHQGMAVRTGI